MKKILTVALAICLAFTLCISSFAADLSNITNDIKTIVSGLNTNPTAAEIKTAAEAVIAKIQGNGDTSANSILDAADKLYADGVITEEVYDEIYVVVASGEFDKSGITTDTAIDAIKALIADDTKTTEEKAAAIADLLSNFSTTEIDTILNTLHTAGILDDDMYNKISDIINNSNSGDAGSVTVPSTDGISDFFNGLLAQLGIGGSGSGSDTESTTKKASSDSSNFEGDKAKTGDYAVVSIAGVALVAGIALVLTKKKK